MAAGNMSIREKMLRLLNNQPIDDVIVSPLIESDYACFITGNQWPTQTGGIDAYIHVGEVCGCDNLFEAQLDWGKYDPALKPKVTVLAEDKTAIRREAIWSTPHGDIRMVTEEKPNLTPYLVEGGIDSYDSFRALEWYFGRQAKCAAGVQSDVEATMKKVGDRGIVRTQFGNTFELSFIKYPEILYLYMDDPQRYMALADAFWEAQKPGIEAAVKGGTDVIYASGVAAELMSPDMFAVTFLPLLKRQSEFVHKLGNKFYYHSCGKTKLFIEKGFYNEILPDLFETLSPPPPGVITDLRAVREKLDPRICTKGNMFNEILRTGTPDQIAEGAKKVVDATWGYRHMVAVSDSVLWGTPVENIRHFVKSAKDYYRQKAKSVK